MFGGDETGAIVIDVGSSTSKFGYAGEDTPKSVFSSAVGTVREDGAGNKYYLGAAGRAFRPHMHTHTPLDYGLVEDWDVLEQIWAHGFSQLRVDAAAHPVLFSEGAITFAPQRERMAEILFEKFNVPALYLARSPTLGAFSLGVSTGVIVDIGASCTRVCPVYDGYVLNKGIHMSEIGGEFLSQALLESLSKSGVEVVAPYSIKKTPKSSTSGSTPSEDKMDLDAAAGSASAAAPSRPSSNLGGSRWDVAKLVLADVTPSFAAARLLDVMDDVKRATLEVHETGYDEATPPSSVSYELPDGQIIKLKALRQQIPELLFRPEAVEPYRSLLLPRHTAGFNSLLQAGVTARLAVERPEKLAASPPISLQHAIHGALLASPADIRRDLCNHVVLTGGGSLIKDIHKRLHWELLALIPAAFKPRVIAPHAVEREFANWIGGSILSSLGTFQQMWFSRLEYEDEGAAAIERKCA